MSYELGTPAEPATAALATSPGTVWSKPWPWVGIILAAVLALVVAGAILGSRPPSSTRPGLSSGTRGAGFVTIVYELEGTALGADITIETPSGTSQQQGVALPMRAESGRYGLTLRVQPGAFVYISGQNTGDTGTLTCRIQADGRVIAENTSSGAYSIVTCSASA